MKLKTLFLTLLISISLANNVFADDAGYDAYEKGDYETAFIEWQKLANQGEPVSHGSIHGE